MAQGIRLTDEEVEARLAAYRACGNNSRKAAFAIGIDPKGMRDTLKIAAKRGLMLDHPPAMPGFEIIKVTTAPNGGKTVTQVQETDDLAPFEMPTTHLLGKVTYQVGPGGKIERHWPRAMPDEAARAKAMRETVAAFCTELPRAEMVKTNLIGSADLANQYTLTDFHFGLLSWKEETGADWDLKIAEKLWFDWFAAAIRQSPDAHTGILAQLGDLLHFDSLQAVTPAHGHILDADSRFAKIVRVVIRCLRQAVRMLLQKHERVHLIFADANHDPASEIWLREMFSAHYENEPRITVDRTAGTYYAFEWGQTALFYHHGHKKDVGNVDRVFAADYAEIFGRTKYRYAHVGHRHSDEVLKTKLMKIEQHETLAARSSYESTGGWRSQRSAKVITYSKRFGEVGRSTLTPEMVMQ